MRPWSYSRLTTGEECLAQYDYSYRQRLPGFRPQEGTAGSRGKAIHSLAEDYLNGKLLMYPRELQKVSAHAMLLKAKQAKPEAKLAVNEKWEPVEYDSPEVYIRAIIDVVYLEDTVLCIEDWKTGQIYPEPHKDQLKTYTAIASAHHPEAQAIKQRCIYIDQGVVESPRITAANRVTGIRQILDGRIKVVESATSFPATAGSHCKWCDYSKRYGGPCASG